MRVRSLGRKYSAHLPQKKTSFCSKEFLGQTVVNPSEDFFSFRVDRLGISRWLPLPCRRSEGVRKDVMMPCGRLVKGVRKSWRQWRHEAFASSVVNSFHPFHPGWCRNLIFCHKQQPSRKKKLEKMFFDVCVYFFSPGCPFVSFWFLKKLRPHFFFAARKIAGIFGLLESSAWGYKGAIGKTNRHPYYSGESSCILGGSSPGLVRINPPRENEPWNWAIRKGNFAQELGTYLLNGMILQVGWKILGGIMVVQCPLLGCPAST